MDPMVRRRAAGSVSDDLDDAFRTALSQEEQVSTFLVPAGTSVQGEASPGTLESGTGRGIGATVPVAMSSPFSSELPTASPFHSEKVQEEIALQKQRPLGLDAEQARLEASGGKGRGDVDVVLEPDYAAAFVEGPSGVPRVARVEPGSSAGMATETKMAAGTEVVVGAGDTVEVPQSPPVTVQHSGIGQGPIEEDPRELIPDTGLSTQVETLLMQVMDENRALRRRSHSSWHSGVPGDAGVGTSPVSFTGEGEARFGEPVQTWSDLGRFVGISTSGLEGARPTNFPGPRGGTGVQGERVSGLTVSGEQRFPEDAGLPVVPATFLEPQGLERCELVPVAGFGTSDLSGFPEGASGSELRSLGVQHSVGVPRAPPPPLPSTIALMSPPSTVGHPQSMRQFAAQAVAEASGLGHQGGFHTPRSSSGASPGFDPSGYPVSPGGTIIRPPPGPPPRTVSSSGTGGNVPLLGRPFHDYVSADRFGGGVMKFARKSRQSISTSYRSIPRPSCPSQQ